MKPIFYVMCGVSGSGKSYWANELKDEKTIIVSTDGIRKELFGDESIQENPKRVFEIAYERIRNNLAQGKNVVFDAMNLRGRDRFALISRFDNMAHMICLVTGNDYEKAIENQRRRDRQVPDEVVRAQCKRFHMPTMDEGWEEIWMTAV